MTLPVRLHAAGPGTARHNRASQPGIAFRAQSDSIKNSRHGGERPGGRRYRFGEVVRQSGIYEVIHDRNHREAHEVVMISGEYFPDCDTCKEKVRFRLIRTAPYIFQDEDFEEEK
jgi:hypothetical protein